jgi:putative transposase
MPGRSIAITTDEVWVEYIKNQTPPEPDDNFNVT